MVGWRIARKKIAWRAPASGVAKVGWRFCAPFPGAGETPRHLDLTLNRGNFNQLRRFAQRLPPVGWSASKTIR